MVVSKMHVRTTFIFKHMELQIMSNLNRVHMRNLHPGAILLPDANLHPGANLHPIASRSYTNKLCPYVPRFNVKFYTRFSVLWRN